MFAVVSHIIDMLVYYFCVNCSCYFQERIKIDFVFTVQFENDLKVYTVITVRKI